MVQFSVYLLRIGVALAACMAILAMSRPRTGDHWFARPFPNVPSSYRAYSNFPKPEIQDREVYFHNVGSSIEGARKADIAFLGHSSLLYALDDAKIRAFDSQHDVRLFNLASAGNASGDFIKAIITRWSIRPKLWIINADDEPVSFFHPGVDDYGATGQSAAPEIVKTFRLSGILRVYQRDVRWFLIDQLERLPDILRKPLFPSFDGRFQTWRSTETGNWIFPRDGSAYNRANVKLSPPIKSCPVAADEIDHARHFLQDIGGKAVFMLVPYSRWCPQHTIELAAALGVELLIPPTTDYTSFDGRHLDRPGAEAFTNWLLDALPTTRAYQSLQRDQVSASILQR